MRKGKTMGERKIVEIRDKPWTVAEVKSHLARVGVERRNGYILIGVRGDEHPMDSSGQVECVLWETWEREPQSEAT